MLRVKERKYNNDILKDEKIPILTFKKYFISHSKWLSQDNSFGAYYIFAL